MRITEEEFNKFVEKLKEELCKCHLVCLTNVKCENCQLIDKLTEELKSGEFK